MNKKKLSTAVSRIIEGFEMFFGVSWTMASIATAIASIFVPRSTLTEKIVYWMFVVFGIWLIFRSRQRKKRRLEREKREKWEAQRKMNVNASKVFEEMAAVTTVMGDMIQKSFSTVNQGTQGQDSNRKQTDMGSDVQGKVITCTCPHCGGINHIQAGKTEACEYCGSVIKA